MHCYLFIVTSSNLEHLTREDHSQLLHANVNHSQVSCEWDVASGQYFSAQVSAQLQLATITSCIMYVCFHLCLLARRLWVITCFIVLSHENYNRSLHCGFRNYNRN